MKWMFVMMAVCGWAACNDRPKGTAETGTVPAGQTDSPSASSAGKVSCSSYFDETAHDPSTPALARAIYLRHDWDLSNDMEALALLDSLTAVNEVSRPFYFKVVTATYPRTDGYFSEGLGLAGKEYVAHNTREFIAYFDNKDCFTGDDLATWADIVLLEFRMGEAEDTTAVDNYIQALRWNCRECTPAQKEQLRRFTDTLLYKWQTFLKAAGG